MIITVIWEDERGGVIRGFGPHDLLLACVRDDDPSITPEQFASLPKRVIAVPAKGNGNVIRKLKKDLTNLRARGPVCAVLDRDKVRNLWSSANRPPDCLSGIAGKIRTDAPGDYGLVLLIQNVESLVQASCRALSVDLPVMKPSPLERDRVLLRAAWGGADARTAIRKEVASFDRLVHWVQAKASAVLRQNSAH